jgi:glycosyltransferase involved in cell wall biosynthesis
VNKNKRLLRTHLGTQIFFDAKKGVLRHDYPGKCPSNLLFVKSTEDCGALVHARDFSTDGGDGPPNIAGLTDERDVVTRVQVTPSEHGLIGLAANGLLLCARPDGSADFASLHMREWERFEVVESHNEESWRPPSARGGTELMLSALQAHVGSALQKINLNVNRFDPTHSDARPIVVWIHNEVSENYNWCNDGANLQRVAAFVFVSNWQMQSFIEAYAIPAKKCVVLRNAISLDSARPRRQWRANRPWKIRCAYISAPYRGLDLLLDSWATVEPANAELHIWSSRKLWGAHWNDDEYEQQLFRRAEEMPNVTYHGIAPNSTIREALEDMHFLVYPSTFLETSCIAAIEAMAAGCRVIAPSLAALPETTAGFGCIYPFTRNRAEHVLLFSDALRKELIQPWMGDLSLADAQQEYCHVIYSWEKRSREWLRLIDDVVS